MNRDFLEEYLQQDIEHCDAIFDAQRSATTPMREKLRVLYGAPLDRHIVYCETDDLNRLTTFPPDTQIAFPVFPFRTLDKLEARLGDLGRFLDYATEQSRIFPVVQHPLYYEGLSHLQPLFETARPPVYFIRGQYAYALLLGLRPDLTDRNGVPVLKDIWALMDHCESNHAKWVENCASDRNCWEERYKRIGQSGDTFNTRLRQSLHYRYASVALVLGKDVTDEIISIFDSADSAKLLLHFHILFDHVICHGFGSDFCFDPKEPSGKDYCDSKPSLLGRAERTLCSNLRILFPTEDNAETAELLREYHPLRGLTADSIGPESIGDIQERINLQLDDYRRKIRRLEGRQKFVQRIISITMLLFGIAEILESHLIPGVGAILASHEFKQVNIPESIAATAFAGFKTLYKHNLYCYLDTPSLP